MSNFDNVRGEGMGVGFTMLPSYYEALRPLPDEERLQMYDAVLDYAFTGKKPENLPLILNGYFILLQPNIDSSVKNYSASVANGRKGGRPRKKTQTEPNENPEETPEETQQEPSHNPEETQAEPSGNREKEKEKEKEKEHPPKSPAGDEGLFERFWEAYPKKASKADAVKAFKKLKVDEALLAEMLAALDWQRVSDGWTRDGGKYIPYPATWLNRRRWEDMPEAPPPPVTTYHFVN